MDELMQKLSGYLDAAAGVITEYAPDAVEAALFVVRGEAIFNLIVSALMLVAAAAVARHVVLPLAKTGKAHAENSNHFDDGLLYFFPAAIITVAAVICSFVALVGLFSFYNWLAAFDPMLGLVYKAASSVGLL